MPCLILTGHPSSGKTTVAKLFRDRATSKFDRVVLINEESACPDHSKSACYKDSYIEKKTRAALKSTFDRTVAASDGSTLIILDSLNYIKGFRYELYCISKSANERHGIIWILNDTATIHKWNSERDEAAAYTEPQMEELIMRYEPPDARNRWDQPLYRIDMRQSVSATSSDVDALQRSVYNMHNLSDALSKPDDVNSGAPKASPQTASAKPSTFKKRSTFRRTSSSSASKDTEKSLQDGDRAASPIAETSCDSKKAQGVPDRSQCLEERIDEILDQFLSYVKPLEEGMSTRQQIATDANVLQNLDALTQRICSAIATAQSLQMTKIEVPSSIDQSQTITWQTPSGRMIPTAELKRIRRQFAQWSQKNPPNDPSELGIATSFLAYLTEALR
ncbi:protein KTI12 [Fistulifera solaris]|jgi:protein KTI12|uniref:Protein KTI12 n=1 Tax=Fistulifera solaris TaxID=1519565 RepID=A0A1Z5JGU3_FISSO|nr:protein KTI12 [Fistulifera solaris]|eukprot:GAX13112.1 protein KTI12 [Fistulifera solaris]